MGNRDLLKLEHKNVASSSLESALLFCQKDPVSQLQKPSGKLVTAPVPTSQVIGKVKDFLEIMAEANKRLQHDVNEKSSKDYDIEILSGNEKEIIEMDLVLGVADLNTPEAVAAAESALAGTQPVAPTAGSSSSESDTESSNDDEDDNEDDDDNDDNDDEACKQKDAQVSKSDKNGSLSNGEPIIKRQKIIELL